MARRVDTDCLPLIAVIIMVIIQPTLTQHTVTIMDIHIDIIKEKIFVEIKSAKIFLYSCSSFIGCSIR